MPKKGLYANINASVLKKALASKCGRLEPKEHLLKRILRKQLKQPKGDKHVVWMQR